jgi:hypothetical protein
MGKILTGFIRIRARILHAETRRSGEEKKEWEDKDKVLIFPSLIQGS